MLSNAEIECKDVDANLKDDNLLGNLDNYHLSSVGEVLIDRLNTVLTQCQPYPGDDLPVDPTYKEGEPWFIIENQDFEMYSIYDWVQGFDAHLHVTCLHWSIFSVRKWFAELCARQNGFPYPWEYAYCWLGSRIWKETTMGEVLEWQAETILHLGAPYDNEEDVAFSTEDQFEVTYNVAEIERFQVQDHYWHIICLELGLKNQHLICITGIANIYFNWIKKC